MEEAKLRVFELADLQPWWGRQKAIQILIFIILGGPILLLSASLIWSIMKPLIAIQGTSLKVKFIIIGGIFGVMFNLNIFLVSIGSKIRDRISWNWKAFYQNWWPEFWKTHFFYFGRSSLIFAVIFLFISDLTLGNQPFSLLYGIIIIGTQCGIGFSIICGALSSIKSGIFISSILKINNPYQRLIYSLWNFDLAIIVHFSIRYSLYKEMRLPLALVYFLNEMSRRHLLEFDGDLDTETGGGSWRWRHRIIQEYFLKAEKD